MPLQRKEDVFTFVPEFDKFIGVTFPMTDSKTDERIIVRVTYSALCDRAQFDGNGDDWMRAYKEHQTTIEALAGANYDNGKPRTDGRVIVDTGELTPLSKDKSYYTARR